MQCATRSRTPRPWPRVSWPPRSTTRSSCPTGASNPTATSTVLPWPTSSTSSPSPWPTWRPSASGAPTGCSIRHGRRACRRSSPNDPGVDSGHMIAQYTQASIVSELKRLAVPASVDSIPSSAMQEDHVSMGWSAGRKLRRSIDGLGRVLGVEVLTAARALDLRSAAHVRSRYGRSAGGGARARRGRLGGPLPGARDRVVRELIVGRRARLSGRGGDRGTRVGSGRR